MFCIEDTICAGRLINEIKSIRQDVELTDAAQASMVLSETIGTDIYRMLSECEHGRLLIKNGFEEDISYCSVLNNINLVASFKTGMIKKFLIPDAEQNIEN
jgi:2-phosphosulfolactate phosphatase